MPENNEKFEYMEIISNENFVDIWKLETLKGSLEGSFGALAVTN